MNQLETRKYSDVSPNPTMIDLSELDLDDLSAEIAQTLAACHALSEVPSSRADGKEKSRPR
jgi:hypothetical protein